MQLSIDMISRLCRETDIRGFHLCTLNLEKSIRRMLQTLGWVKGDEPPFERSALDGPDGLKVKNQMISVSDRLPLIDPCRGEY